MHGDVFCPDQDAQCTTESVSVTRSQKWAEVGGHDVKIPSFRSTQVDLQTTSRFQVLSNDVTISRVRIYISRFSPLQLKTHDLSRCIGTR